MSAADDALSSLLPDEQAYLASLPERCTMCKHLTALHYTDPSNFRLACPVCEAAGEREYACENEYKSRLLARDGEDAALKDAGAHTDKGDA